MLTRKEVIHIGTAIANIENEFRTIWARINRGVRLFERTEYYDGWFISIRNSGNALDLFDPGNDVLWYASSMPRCLAPSFLKLTYAIEYIEHGFFPAGWHGVSREHEASILKELWLHAAALRYAEFEAELALWRQQERARKRREKLERKKRLQKIESKLLRRLHD